ncbi:MAG: hypothetical protein KF878_22565 [Planctomycetes bacterium]|nr:hypothetical protein [Planctomycetota bacterium]
MLESPREPETSRRRAIDRCLGGELAGALDDAEVALKHDLWRDSGWSLLIRAFVRALSDDRAGALDDLRDAQRRAPRFHHLALWRAGLGETGVEPPDLEDLPAWPAQLVEAALERADPAALLGDARTLPGRRARVVAQQEVHWLQGLLAEQEQRRGEAIACYQRVVELGDTTWLQYAWSFARLRGWGLAPGHRPPER